MEKYLFYILQELKREINTIDLKYLQDKLIVLDNDCSHEIDNFNYYNKKFFINNIKFLLLKILMFGRCTANQTMKYKYIRDNLEETLDSIEEKYNSLLTEFTITELLLKINTNKEKSFKNNFEQIDTFLDYIDKLDDIEKEKVFSYKMGVNNG